MDKIHKESRKTPQNSATVILLNHQIQQEKLINVNRYLMGTVFVLMCLVFTLGFFVIPDNDDMIKQLKSESKFSAMTGKDRAITAELDILKGEMIALMSGTIDNKLKTLESSVKLGSSLGSIQSLQMLQEVRNDVSSLNKYSDPLQQKQQQVAEANAALLTEISQLKGLVYLTLGSSSLMFCGIFLVWLKRKKRLAYQQQDEQYLIRVKGDS